MYDKPFVAQACDIGVRQESQPITLDATFYPYLMRDIVSVFDLRFRWRYIRLAIGSAEKTSTNVGHKNAHRNRT
jgi:hypothetical protein